MTLKERMHFLIEKEGLNPNQFYTISGLGNGYLDKIGETFRKPTIEKIRKKFPHWNMDWILYMKGEPFQDVSKHSIPHDAEELIPLHSPTIMMVPLVNQYAYGGFLSGYSDDTYLDELPKIPFMVDREYKGNYLSFEVKGDSMDDGSKRSLEPGDILLGREISPEFWKSKLHIKKWDAFIIAHRTEGIVVKQIIDHDVENGIITCHSYNPLFENFRLNLSEVIRLYNVVKVLKSL